MLLNQYKHLLGHENLIIIAQRENFMFDTFKKTWECSIPSAFFPTTVVHIDDDKQLLAQLSGALSSHYKIETFSDPDEALREIIFLGTNYMREEHLSLKNDEDILSYRQGFFDARRFENRLICIVDYDMPGRNGADLMYVSQLAKFQSKAQEEHAYILLTSKDIEDIKEENPQFKGIKHVFISKRDKDCIPKLLESINAFHQNTFQTAGYSTAIALSQNPKEKSSFEFCDKFLPIFNQYIREHDICEGYLFDRQGGMIFLDKGANLSWLFVRNEYGIINGLENAYKYGAPDNIIDLLKSREYILSLYEPEDFAARDKIDWDKYLLKVDMLKDDAIYKDETINHLPANYYYAFTDSFPEHGIDKEKILSFQAFLNHKDTNDSKSE